MTRRQRSDAIILGAVLVSGAAFAALLIVGARRAKEAPPVLPSPVLEPVIVPIPVLVS